MFDANKVSGQITDWIAAFFRDNGPPDTKAVVGISGGKDSSVVAALCVRALGKERVLGVLMPQGVQHDIDVSRKLCETLDIQHIEVNINDPVLSIYREITGVGVGAGAGVGAGMELNDIARFNTPARVRMTILYAVSGIVGGRVANTSNYSEDWVGYATKFGDSAGDFSPLSNLTVTEVKAVGRELGLAEEFIEKIPIDGLCGKTDEENLGFTYAVLDRYIREGVCDDPDVKNRIDYLHRISRHKVTPMPAFVLE